MSNHVLPAPRSLTLDDAPAAARLEQRCHISVVLEGTGFFKLLSQQWPNCAYVIDKPGTVNELAAYCLAHPVQAGSIPKLGSLPASKENSDWFIHDVVVDPEYRGQGLPRMLLISSVGHALTRGLASTALVALAGREGYWAQFGFAPTEVPIPADFGYGKAVYMTAGTIHLYSLLTG